MNSYSRRMIEEFYDDEENETDYEAFNMKMTVSGQIADVTMLDAIAGRFGKTRSALVSEILHNSVMEMFNALTLRDKKSLSEISDLETTRIYTKNGISQETSCAGLPPGQNTTTDDMTWRCLYEIYKENAEKKDDANS